MIIFRLDARNHIHTHVRLTYISFKMTLNFLSNFLNSGIMFYVLRKKTQFVSLGCLTNSFSNHQFHDFIS